jgi:septal ring factor EnvC (AmiA/AmiB activator)
MDGSPSLRQQLEQRLDALQREFETGQRVLAELEAKQASLRDTLLRLSGAITVLREELDGAGDSAAEQATDERHAG